jgi:hypothetical protein
VASSSLSRVPIATRRRLGAVLGLFAVLFVAVGALAASGPGSVGRTVLVLLSFVVAAVLGLVAWGVYTSVRDELAEHRLDAVLTEAVSGYGGMSCGCGHEHDPAELHITDAEPETGVCAHDGAGQACAHDCSTCALAALRPSR